MRRQLEEELEIAQARAGQELFGWISIDVRGHAISFDARRQDNGSSLSSSRFVGGRNKQAPVRPQLRPTGRS